MVTGQAPVTLELRNTLGKKHKPKVVQAYHTQLAKMSFDKIFDLPAGCILIFIIYHS